MKFLKPKNTLNKENLRNEKKWDGRNKKGNGPSADVLKLIQTIRAQGRAYRNENHSQERKKCLRDWITIVVLAFTCAAVVYQVIEMKIVYTPIKEQADASKDLAAQALAQSKSAQRTAEVAEKTLLQAHRAWVGPTNAGIDTSVVKGMPVDVKISVRNIGQEPAKNFVWHIAPAFTSFQESDSSEKTKSDNFVKECRSRKPKMGSQVIYPSASAGYIFNTRFDSSLITDKVISGEKILMVNGCLIYTSFEQTRHSSFCYYFVNGQSRPGEWNLCTSGNEAD